MARITHCTALISRLVTMVVLIALLGSNTAAATPLTEVQSLTIAFLYNFMKLSAWPSETSATELTLCVTEGGEFGAELDSMIGKPVQNKTLSVKRLVLGDNPNDCDLLFLPGEEKPIRLHEWLKLIESKPVLTVSDAPHFLDEGGMISLVNEDNRLQFEVNLELVEKAGIEMSSQILKIARDVRGK